MKIKTITTYTPEEQDEKVNEFNENHTVSFTQTHVNINTRSNELVYTTILYYIETKK